MKLIGLVDSPHHGQVVVIFLIVEVEAVDSLAVLNRLSYNKLEILSFSLASYHPLISVLVLLLLIHLLILIWRSLNEVLVSIIKQSLI